MLYDLSWGAAIGGPALFAAGYGLLYLSARIGVLTDQPSWMLLIWPYRILGGALMVAAVFVVFWNMLSPLVMGAIRLFG